MHLILKWKSNSNNVYTLGKLSKKECYIFEINEDELKRAIQDGCMGIGNFSLLNKIEKSDELFDFFKYRIVDKNSPKVEMYLKKYDLKKYDEMKILEITGARSVNDRYWLEKE